jgi:O-antigen ligase
MSMFKANPLLGVGTGQFTEHHFLTAHNSYVLAPAELGFPGFVLFMTVLWLSVKVPVSALKRLSSKDGPGPEADVARAWAGALLASFVGMAVGIFFLSFCYHQVLWTYIGLSGAFYCAMKRHDPEWQVRFRLRDFAGVVLLCASLVVVLFGYTRLKAP